MSFCSLPSCYILENMSGNQKNTKRDISENHVGAELKNTIPLIIKSNIDINLAFVTASNLWILTGKNRVHPF